MTDLHRSVYASVPFKFVIDGKPFYIHADLVSLHSKPLDRMMNGPMAEAQEGVATLKDVDEGTFVRFIEWAHKGYYTPAEFSISINSPPAPRSPIVEENVPTSEEAQLEPEPFAEVAIAVPPGPYVALPQTGPFGSRPAQSCKKGKKKRITRDTWGNEVVHDDWGLRENLKEVFKSRTYTVRQGFVETPSPRPNRSEEEDYTDVFLSHAKLYVFADKNDIQSLKTLALEELHATLVVYTLYDVRTGDIIELLRYVYANTCEPQEGVDDMRSMMMQYVVREMDTLMEAAELRELIIEDGGDLLHDFMRAVTTRIRND